MRPGQAACEALLVQVEALLAAGTCSAGDAQIARRLVYVLTGGAPAVPTWLDERELHELERATFMALVREPHSQACIRHMLRTNRPLRHAREKSS